MVGRRIRKERCRRLIDPCLRKSRKKDSFENCLRGCMSVRMGSCKRLLSVVYVKSRQCIPYPRSPPKKRHRRPSLRPRKTKKKTLKKLGISLLLSTSGLAKASQEKETKTKTLKKLGTSLPSPLQVSREDHAKLHNKLATTPTDQPANTATFAAPEGTFPAALFGRGEGGETLMSLSLDS